MLRSLFIAAALTLVSAAIGQPTVPGPTSPSLTIPPASAKTVPGRVDRGVRRWPVHIVDGDSHPAGQPPAVVVGALFTGGHCYREDDAGTIHRTPKGQIVLPARLTDNRYSKAMGEYLLGNVRPRPSCDEEETCVFVTSPPQDNYADMRIDSIEQEGSTFTLTASFWQEKRTSGWGPGPRHTAQMVRLGWLPAGEYTLIYNLRQLESDPASATPGLYRTLSTRTGSTAFSVAKSDAWRFHSWQQAPSTSIISDQSLSSVPQGVTPLDPTALEQEVFFAHRAGADAQPEPTVRLALAPAVDWRKHSQEDAALWQPAAPGSGGPASSVVPAPTLVATITGGRAQSLGRWDWAEVNAITWNGQTVTIHVNIWRKPYIYGNDKTSRTPQFAVPLETRHLGPDPQAWSGAVTPRVVWHEGIDNPRDAVEEVRR